MYDEKLEKTYEAKSLVTWWNTIYLFIEKSSLLPHKPHPLTILLKYEIYKLESSRDVLLKSPKIPFVFLISTMLVPPFVSVCT